MSYTYQIISSKPDETDLITNVANLLLKQGITLALAESCTGGLVMANITALAGSSNYFLGGVVAYSNDVKNKILGVPADIIKKHGAVSEPTARAMAHGVHNLIGAHIGLSITGIAGPGGGSAEKPVGTVYIALFSQNYFSCQKYLFHGQRQSVQQSATTACFEIIQNFLAG